MYAQRNVNKICLPSLCLGENNMEYMHTEKIILHVKPFYLAFIVSGNPVA